MSKQLFISYSTADEETALELCRLLEERGVSCWIAPREIPPGADWAEQIMEAIADCRGVVFLMSGSSAESDQVPNELNEAFARGKDIYQVRLEPVEPPSGLRYFLGRKQRVDAFGRPLSEAVTDLVQAVRGAGRKERSAPTFRDLPIVDRVTVRERLEDLAGQVARHGRGLVVVVEGPAGVGKTRLLEWCEQELASIVEARVVWGKHTGWDVPWEGVRGALEALFGLADAPRPLVEQKLRAKLERWGGVDEEEVRMLAHLVRPQGGMSVDAMDAGGVRVHECLGRTLRRFAREQPLAVFLEDIHWADEQSVGFLEYITGSLEHRSTPLFLVATLRTEDLAANRPLQQLLHKLTRYAGRTFERFRLEHLDPGNARALIEQALPGGFELSGALADCTDGCPLYILEILRHLHERGLLQRREGRWRVGEGVDLAAEIPDSLAGLVSDRINLLTEGRPWLDTIVTFAAAAGADFDLKVLERALEVGEREEALQWLDQGLEELQEAGMVEVELGPASCRVSFAHDLVHRAVREEKLGGLRSRLRGRRVHLAVARAKGEVHRESIGEYAAEIAEHYELGGQPQRASELYLKAAETAVWAFCYADALRLYEKADSLAEDAESIVSGLLDDLPDPQAECFVERASDVLARCVAAAVGGADATDLWDRALARLEAGLSGPAADRLVTEADKVLSFLTYAAQTRRQPDLWDDITKVASIPIRLAELEGSVLNKAQILDHLGFAGESLARLTGEENSGPDFARRGAACYLEAYEELGDRPNDALRAIEPAAWCFKRADDYERALESTREFMEVAERCGGAEAAMRKEILAEGYRELAEEMIVLKRGNPEREGLVAGAAENLRRAALQRLGTFPESWFARWCTRLADQLEETGDCNLDMPVDASEGDVLLVHNRLDALAADVVREHLRERDLTCVSTGPEDPRTVDEMERTYRHIVIFGSTLAPKMERFSYLFMGEEDVWRLNSFLSRVEPFYSSWVRPKGRGEGQWVMVAGSTRIDTILAAGAFELSARGD